MRDLHEGFVTRSFLRSVWALDYEAFKGSQEETDLLDRLNRWSARTDLKETSAESAFLEEFFVKTWGYVQSGQTGAENSFSLYPRFTVAGAGARGGTGEADAALGIFTEASGNLIPQVLCEFKDIKSSLDAPQKRKGNNRSPVQQGLDYLSHARHGLFGNEPVLPTWAIVTDMNEFRLYWADRGKRQSLRFTIRPENLFQGSQLTADNEDARFERFLFYRIFHADTLLVRGRSGRSLLAQLIAQQWVRERELENDFYKEYRAYREHLYQAMLEANPEGTDRFPGTKGRLVRLAQKILDRCIFIFYCEDMGRALGFPPQLLRDFLIHESNDEYYDPESSSIWRRLVALFTAMNDGTAFGQQTLNQFNGGLFASDPELEALEVPNRVFCQQGQGQNEASLYSYQLTLLYLSASYNYASTWADGLTRVPVSDGDALPGDAVKSDPTKSLGLYTLGRIFEQSITELEILEAEADGRASLNKVNKRKRDGVYYTPEWVVDFIVEETIGSRLRDIKNECGWPKHGSNKLPKEQAVLDYEERLKALKVVDPACGSGAFLITALRYLLDEWNAVQELRKQVSKDYKTRDGENDALIRDILRDNLYGVDINPASVEITKLALWLHTARGDKPLSSLDDHIRDGNSLIGNNFYDGLAPYTEEEKERINAFDWQQAFPGVFEKGGFDAVIGNPPYVKLQNFKKVHEDMARFLRDGAANGDKFASTQTGNFDLFLPFIEKGIDLLNEHGRLGYIAPNVWTMNEYGQGLRESIEAGRHLYGWIDFQSYQVFDEATTYTSLQFFSKQPNDTIKVAFLPDGTLGEDPWGGNDSTLSYEQLTFGDRWLMTTGADRELINKMISKHSTFGSSEKIQAISQGIISGAFPIYSFRPSADGNFQNSHFPELGSFDIESDLLRLLVSGEDVRRFIKPSTSLHILFPYKLVDGGIFLIEPKEMEADYPNAWKYLSKFEAELRDRDSGSVNDDRWYRYSRTQNLTKQSLPKILIAGTVNKLRCSIDYEGEVAANDKRVYTITAHSNENLLYICGILNSSAVNFVFKSIARPKANGYYDVEQQFLAPLPLPDMEPDTELPSKVNGLHELHSKRRDLIIDIDRRLQVVRFKNKPVTWLFPDLATARNLQDDAPSTLERADQRAWAKARHEQELEARHTALGARLSSGCSMDASYENGELRYFIDGAPIIEQIFVNEDEGRFILAQWKLLASTFSVTEKTDGKKLANALRKIGDTNNRVVIDQVIALQEQLSQVEQQIETAEAALNAEVYALYGLDSADIRRIEAG